MSVVDGMVLSMSFPTADILSGQERLLHAWGIANTIKQRRPDLADRLITTDTEPLVRLVLPDSRGVACGPVQLGNVVNWIVMTPDSDLESHMEGRFDTHTTDELADMMITAYGDLASARN